MQANRKIRSKAISPVLAGLCGFLLIVGISFGGALLWQNIEKVMAGSEPDDSRVSAIPPDDPTEAVTTDISENESAAVTPDDEESDIQESNGGSSVDVSLEDDPAPPEMADETAYRVEGQLPASKAVDNSYFDDAIFFGDSITTGIAGYRIADNAACIAAIGIGPHNAVDGKYIGAGQEKQTMLDAAKDKGERAKVYIMLGGNALWMDKEAFVKGYQEFIDAVKEQYPKAVIYIQSMTPVTDEVHLEYSEVSNEKVMEYNIEIAALAAKNKLPFVNVFEGLAGPDGYLPRQASGDGLHLSPEYYYKWFDYLKTHTK